MHVDGSAAQTARLRAAAQLASRFDAHLVGSASTGISWFDYSLLVSSMGAPMLPEADFNGVRDAVRKRLEEFTVAATRLGAASVETHMLEEDTRYALLLESRYCDLLVVSRDSEPIGSTALNLQVRGLPQHLAMQGVRPVLVVPPDWQDRPLPGTAIVGWDGSTQAQRAIDGALPLLQQASNVKLTLVNPETLGPQHGDEPGADMARYLARHGVKVEVQVEHTHTSTGDALCAVARSYQAGLLVTGAYGHSRYRELVLGGVTRLLLERSHIPLLLAH